MANETLRDLLGVKAAKPYGTNKNPDGVDPSLLYGLELEIEGLDDDEDQRAARAVAGMQYHKDGSLRNNGGEFVTLPMTFANLQDTLNSFFDVNDNIDSDNYSERCSVHVHANCQDLTLDQIRLVLCLYQVLEKIFFNYIKADRDNNIFCVPIGESTLGTRIMTNPNELLSIAHRKWRKYTALNLLPLYTLGTMEFRHMAGTCDVPFILQWCNIIGSLFKYAREHKYDDVIKAILSLNTSSAYGTFMQGIFSPELYDVLATGPYREYLEEGVINMKVMLAPQIGKTNAPQATWDFDTAEEAAPPLPVPELPDAGVRDPRLPQTVTWNRPWQDIIDRHNMWRLNQGIEPVVGLAATRYLNEVIQEQERARRNRRGDVPAPAEGNPFIVAGARLQAIQPVPQPQPAIRRNPINR